LEGKTINVLRYLNDNGFNLRHAFTNVHGSPYDDVNECPGTYYTCLPLRFALDNYRYELFQHLWSSDFEEIWTVEHFKEISGVVYNH
jgi:hypothetical protein